MIQTHKQLRRLWLSVHSPVAAHSLNHGMHTAVEADYRCQGGGIQEHSWRAHPECGHGSRAAGAILGGP